MSEVSDMSKWIRVEDRLPETDRTVWVTICNLGTLVVTKTWFLPHLKRWNEYEYNILAWMPIEATPEPYNKSYNFETLDTVSKTDEPDDEYVKTYREDFEDKYPKSWCNGLCVNVLYYGSEDCRCPGISCKECWNRDLGT